MKISTRGMILIVISILANNLLWLYVLENNDISNDEKQLLLTTSTDNNGGLNPVGNKKQNNLLQNIPIPECSSQKGKSTKTNKRIIISESDTIKSTVGQNTPFTSATIDRDVPIELSQDLLYEHTIDREEFFYANTERKLDTIQSLLAQGDDLKLIRQILKTEDNSDLRIKALNRLNHEHSYLATNTLVEALDDPAEEVVLTALNTIVSNGDRTLLPLLKNKMNLISGNAIRDKYEKSIHRLNYSVTMGMDEIPME